MEILDIKPQLKNGALSGQDLNFEKIYKESLVLPSDEMKPPEIALSQSINGSDIMIATLGNFTLISGRAKQGKSFLMTLISSVMISKKMMFGLKNCLPENKRNVIYFDTEQSRFHVGSLVKRICKLSSLFDPPNLKVHALRGYSASEMLQIIEKFIYQTNGLGIVIIDGIKDLVTSINDEEQANIVSNKLLKWTQELNIHIYVVLHQNKGDNNARGHLGTELVNKCETYFSVTKSEGDKNISIVNPESSRNIEPETFAFEIIEGLPAEVENFEIRNATRKNSFSLDNIEGFKKFELLNDIYSNGIMEYSYKDLHWNLKKAFEKTFGKSLSDHKCRNMINEFKDQNWIIQEKPKGPYTQGQYNNGLEI